MVFSFYCFLSLFSNYYLWCHFLLFTSPGTAETAPCDVAALAALKASVVPSTIPPWSCLASWNFTMDPCVIPRREHFTCGVTCSSESRIVGITLDPVGYSGQLSPNSFSNLTALRHLDLSNNNFHGHIHELSFASLSSLQTLTLASNSFSGDFASSSLFANLTSLFILDISDNNFSGELPDALGRLISLSRLDLSFNSFTGTLSRHGYLPPNIIDLALRGNQLTGILPRSVFEELKYLEVVELAGNKISGGVEGWLLRLPSLQQIDLANNSLTHISIDTNDGGGLVGESGVVAVELGFNRIEGLLPVSFARTKSFPALAALSFRHNRSPSILLLLLTYDK